MTIKSNFITLTLIFLIGVHTPVKGKLNITLPQFLNMPTSHSSFNLNLSGLSMTELETLNTQGDGLTIKENDPDPISTLETVAKRLIGTAFNYPNPVRKGQGTELGYELSKPMDIDILIYDSRGFLIFQHHFTAGKEGSNLNYNKVNLKSLGFHTQFFSTGIYYYLIMNEGKVLGKGKMAIIP